MALKITKAQTFVLPHNFRCLDFVQASPEDKALAIQIGMTCLQHGKKKYFEKQGSMFEDKQARMVNTERRLFELEEIIKEIHSAKATYARQ